MGNTKKTNGYSLEKANMLYLKIVQSFCSNNMATNTSIAHYGEGLMPSRNAVYKTRFFLFSLKVFYDNLESEFQKELFIREFTRPHEGDKYWYYDYVQDKAFYRARNKMADEVFKRFL